MPVWILLSLFIGALVLFGVGVTLYVLVRSARASRESGARGLYPQGHWMSIGMLTGLSIGLIPSFAGLIFDEIAPFVAIGPAVGCGLGVAIGGALERKHKSEIRPLTDQERATRSRAKTIGMGLVFLLVLSLGWVLWSLSLQ